MQTTRRTQQRVGWGSWHVTRAALLFNQRAKDKKDDKPKEKTAP
jgi:hypothetical protein